MTSPPPDRLLEQFAELPSARPLLARLAATQADVYVVGGAVRDLLLGDSPVDVDLVVDGELAAVTSELGDPLRSHDRFATATLVLDGLRYDLARARRETYPRPGALPEVGPASIREDLLRRDFTANAIALGIAGEARGRTVAAPGALEDLERGTLRVLHDGSFLDDPTRLLRLARYAGRLQFEVEDHTRALADQAVASGALQTVSGTRIGTELRLLIAEPAAVAEFRRLAELGVDEALTPGFGLRSEAQEQLAARALELLPPDGDRGALLMAVASMGVAGGATAVEALLDALAFPAGRRDAIVDAATRAQALAEVLAGAEHPSQIAGAGRGRPVEEVALAGALGAAAAARWWLDELRHVRLEIDGSDLLERGIPAGPAIGAGLASALAARLDGRAPGRDEQLAEALRAARLRCG